MLVSLNINQLCHFWRGDFCNEFKVVLLWKQREQEEEVPFFFLKAGHWNTFGCIVWVEQWLSIKIKYLHKNLKNSCQQKEGRQFQVSYWADFLFVVNGGGVLFVCFCPDWWSSNSFTVTLINATLSKHNVECKLFLG